MKEGAADESDSIKSIPIESTSDIHFENPSLPIFELNSWRKVSSRTRSRRHRISALTYGEVVLLYSEQENETSSSEEVNSIELKGGRRSALS